MFICSYLLQQRQKVLCITHIALPLHRYREGRKPDNVKVVTFVSAEVFTAISFGITNHPSTHPSKQATNQPTNQPTNKQTKS
jgi:hypothetical protein